MINKLTTYIICGGKSSRMGSDKASMLFNEQSFLSHIIKACSKLDAPIKLVSSLTQHKNLEYSIVPDLKKEKGPVCGITSALSETNTSLNLILSCDIPLIKYNLISWLINQHSANYDVTIISHMSKKMPLIGVYNASCSKIFKTHLKNQQLKLMNVLNDLKVNYVEVPKKWSLQITNINTLEDLKAVQL